MKACCWAVFMLSTLAVAAGCRAADPTTQPATQPATAPAGLRVATAGHSFHVWVAQILSEMASSAGIKGHRIAGEQMIGGSQVIQHWDLPDDKNKIKRNLIAGDVDVLTLSPIWMPDEGIEKFARLALEHNPNVRVTVQIFWLPNDEYVPVYPLQTGKKVDHDATDLKKLDADYAKYAKDVNDYVCEVNKKLGKDVVVTVPVGAAVNRLREKVVAGQAPGVKTQKELFRDSWGHPSGVIEVLAGYCHFAVIYGRSPVGLPMPPGLERNKDWNNPELNKLLQELVWEAVQKQAADAPPQ